jgi:transketolase
MIQLPQLANSSIEKATRGGYVLEDTKDADITIISTGSEIPLCVEAVQKLSEKGIKARVVSMPCIEVFVSHPLASVHDLC